MNDSRKEWPEFDCAINDDTHIGFLEAPLGITLSMGLYAEARAAVNMQDEVRALMMRVADHLAALRSKATGVVRGDSAIGWVERLVETGDSLFDAHAALKEKMPS